MKVTEPGERPDAVNPKVVGSLTMEVVVPEAPEGEETAPLDLGSLALAAHGRERAGKQ